MNDLRQLSFLIRAYRCQNRLTIKALAEKAGVSFSSIAMAEKGKLTANSKVLKKILKTLKIKQFLPKTTDYHQFWKNIRLIRKSQHIKQKIFAEKLGLSPEYYNQVETGLAPARGHASKAAEFFNLSIREIIDLAK